MFIASTLRFVKLVTATIHATTAQALLDSGALPKLQSSRVVYDVYVETKASTKKITVASREGGDTTGAVSDLEMFLEDIEGQLEAFSMHHYTSDVNIAIPV